MGNTNVNVQAVLSGNPSGMVNAFNQASNAGKQFAQNVNSAAASAAQSSKQMQDALNKQAAAARTAADAAKAAAEKSTQARNTAAAQAAVAADKEVAAHKRAGEAAKAAAEAKVKADATGTQAAQQAAAAQQVASERAANAATLASQQKINASMKAATAADDEAKKVAAAMRAEEGATAAAAKAAEYAEQSKREARARSLQDLNAYTQNHRAQFQTIGNLALGAGAVVAAGIAMMVKAYMDFDKAMSGVRAATRASGDDFEALRTAAIKAGADTAFSAEQAAQGITELAKAGVKTQDILKGGLTGALALAAAGEISVAEAAELAATAMVTFKLSGEKIPHIADLLAAAAGKAQGSVHDMGEALKMSALVSDSLGISIEDTVGTLAAFANAGLIGSDAGTSFKTMLMRLTPQSEEARDAMSELGFAAFNASGEFIGMPALAQELQDSFKGMDTEARASAMGVMFGADAVRAANILYTEGAAGIQEWLDNVNAAGYAAAQASILQDNLAGDIEKLSGSINSVFIQAGSGMNEVLRDIVQGATDLVNWIGTLDPDVLELGVKFGLMATAGLLIIGTFSKMLPGIMAAVTAFKNMDAASSPIPDRLTKMGKAAAVAAAAMAALAIIGPMVSDDAVKDADDYAAAILRVSKAGEAAAASDLDSVFQGWGKLFGTETLDNVQGMSKAVEELANQDFNDWMNVNFADTLNEALGFTKTSIGQVTERMQDFGKELASIVKNGSPEAAAKSFQLIAESFVNQGKTVRDALNYMPEYEAALKAQADALGITLNEQQLANLALGEVPQSMQDAYASTTAAAEGLSTYADAAGGVVKVTPEMQDELDTLGVSIDGVVKNLDAYLDALFKAGFLQMDARDALANFNQTFIEADKATKDLKASQAELGPIFNQNATDFNFTTESGIKANSMFNDLTRSGLDTASAMAKNGETMPVVQQQLRDTYDAMVVTAMGFGMGKAEAELLTASVLKIPPGVDIPTWMSDQAKIMANDTKTAVDAIPPRKDIVLTFTTNYLTGVDQRSQLPDLNGSEVSGSGRIGGIWMGGPVRRATGGPIPGFADGGFSGAVQGPGTSVSDSILTALSAGEYVIQAKSVEKYGQAMMAAINGGNWEGSSAPMSPSMADGGVEESVKRVSGLFNEFARESDATFKDFHATSRGDFELWGRELAADTDSTWTEMRDTTGAALTEMGATTDRTWNDMAAITADQSSRINNEALVPLQQNTATTGNQFVTTGQVVATALNGMQNSASAAASWINGNAFIPLQDGAAAVGNAFPNAASVIESAWVRIQNSAKDPVRFIIETVYNNGIKAMWDKAAGFLGLEELPAAAVPAFHDGGVMSGWSPGVDDRLIAVGGGEAIMRPEWTATVGKNNIDRMNQMARSNDGAGIKAAMGATAGPVSGAFADGGVFDPAAAKATTAGMPGAGSQWADGLVTMTTKIIDGLAAKAAAAAAAMAAASAMAGNPLGAWTGGASGLGNPLPGSVISQWFSGAHNGLDMAAPQGSAIGSAGPGVVSFSGWSGFGGGNEVHVDHPNGLQTWYAHMASPGLGVGSQVSGGSYLGPVGTTGNSTGPHLHFMVLNGGWPNVMDPAPFIGLNQGGVVPTFDRGGTLGVGLNLVNNATGAPEEVRPTSHGMTADQLAEAITRGLSNASLRIDGIDKVTGAIVGSIVLNTSRKAGIR